MKPIAALIITIAAALALAAQRPDDILATVNGQSVHFRDLSDDTQKIVADVPARTAKFRSDLLAQMMNERALAAEAKAVGSTPGKLISAEKAKVPAPSDAQIDAVISANQAALAGISPAEARKEVVEYLRSEPEQKALVSYFDTLTKKYKAT